MFANHSNTDKIYSIGTPTGWFLGEFTDPIPYILPNSKLKVKIAPTTSLTNVTSWKNVMLDYYDYTVYPTIEEYRVLDEQTEILYSKNYLFENDPYFRETIKSR